MAVEQPPLIRLLVSTLTFANTFRVVSINTYTLQFDGDGGMFRRRDRALLSRM